MQTHSFLQRRANIESSDRVVAHIKPRSWGDEIHQQPQTVQPQNTGFDFKNADWFSHDPGPRSPVRVFNTIQARLTVGAPNDQYEQEADRVAEQVMSTPDAATHQAVQREDTEESAVQTKPLAATITPLVQRDMVPEEEEDPDAKALQGKLIQREAALPEEEEDPDAGAVQGKLIQRKAAGFQAQASVEQQLDSSKASGTPLPEDVRAFMEPRFGADFSQVRVHTGNEAVQMNQDLNAQAFTHKQDVYFGAGKSPAKDALTAHELTHVVQQTGAVQTKQISEQPIVQLKCSACENEEAEVQRSPNVSAISEPGIQRWSLFGDDEEKKESEGSSGGGVLDWAKEKASGAVDSVSQAGGDAVDWAKEKGGAAVDTVTQAGGDAYDWAKEKGGAVVDTVTQAGGDAYDWAKQTGAEYSNALLEQKKASLIAQINEARQKLSGQESIPISGNQVATLNNHLATLRKKSQGLISVPGISAETGSATGEKAVRASTIESLLTNLESSISSPLTSSTSSNSGSLDSGSVQGSIQRFLSPAAVAAIAAAGAAGEETAAVGAPIAAVAAPETAGISIAVLVVAALVVAVIVGITVYVATKDQESNPDKPKEDADTKPKTRRFPNQTCENDRMETLEGIMHGICDKGFSCSDGTEKLGRKKEELLSREQLLENIARAKACIQARQDIQDECFKNSTDPIHAKVISEIEQALKTCEQKYISRHGPLP